MTLFARNKFFSTELKIRKPSSTYHFDQSFGSIEAKITKLSWNPQLEGPIPQENDSDYEPYNWYTIEWWENTLLQQSIDWDGYTF